MAFIIRNQKDRLNQPNGLYITHQEREWLVQDITLTKTGNVTLKLYDSVRLENQIVTPCNLGDLQALLEKKTTGE
jgi:hypothetical protein